MSTSEYHYLVTVTTDTREHADELMHERLDRYERRAFEYETGWLPWDRLEAGELMRLRRVIDRYADHDNDCAAERAFALEGGSSFSDPCDCGFDAAVYAAHGATDWPRLDRP